MTRPPFNEPWLRVEDVESLFNVDYKTLVRWDQSGRLPTVRTPSGHRRWRQYDVDALRSQRPLPLRDAAGVVVAESPDRPRETAVDGLTPERGA